MTDSRPASTYISDLRPSRVATFEAVVASLAEVREVETKEGHLRKVRDGVLRDATGEIALVLWGSDVDRVRPGDRIRVVDGWVSERRGKAQVSLGRSGRLETLGSPTTASS
jgi:ssDNA-binding replication factor A large subunit